MNEAIQKRLSLIGWYEIISGIFGIIITIYSASVIIKGTQGKYHFLSVIIILSVGLLYSFSVLSGWFLIKMKLKKGVLLSNINQTVQVLMITIAGFSYKFIAGVLIGFTLDLNTYIININFELPSFSINYSSHSTDLVIGINFMPFIVIYILGKTISKIHANEKLASYSSSANA